MTIIIRQAIIIFLLCIICVPQAEAIYQNYCATPPFISSQIKPNVLLIVDNSGSMKLPAYWDEDVDVEEGTDTSFDPQVTYYGIFNPNAHYAYSHSGNYFYESTSGEWSGKFLNWLTMRRYDILLKILIGGNYKIDSNGNQFLQGLNTLEDENYVGHYAFQKKSDSTGYFPSSYQNQVFVVGLDRDGNEDYPLDRNDRFWFKVKNKTTNEYDWYAIRVRIDEQPTGILQEISNGQLRLGLMVFNHGNRYEDYKYYERDGGYVVRYISDNNTDLAQLYLNQDVYTSDSSSYPPLYPHNWTPLGETLYEAVRYFQAKSSAYNDVDYSNYDPIQFWCQKNFVIIITDGESTKDQNLPNSCFSGYDPISDSNFNIEYWMDKIATNEGYDSQKCSDLSDDGSYYLEGVAYYSHTTDIREDLPNKQNLTLFTIYTFGKSSKARDMLSKAAKYGGFSDSNNNNIPDVQSEWDTDGDGIPDNYFSAASAEEIKNALMEVIKMILRQTSSGTSVSVISEKTRKGANLIQAVFYPEKSFENGTGTVKVSWVGFLNNFWLMRGDTPEAVTLREDTDEDKALSLYDDWIMEFANINNQLTINLYHDYDKDGICDNQDSNGTCIPDAQKNLDETKKIWEAGEILHQTSPNERKIWVNLDLNGDGAVNLEDAFKESSYTQLKTYLEETDDTKAQEIISYIRGEEIYGARSRLVNGKVWKLSDIIYSTPQVVDYDDYSVVYVGANDGMLHAFRLGKLTSTGLTGDHITKLCDSSAATCTTTEVGKEIWSFIPRNSLPYLKYLMDNDYCHLYYVDLTPFVFEATVGTETRTILIGGMRLGGACGCTGTNCIQPPAIYCKDSSNNIVDCSQAGAIPYCVFEDGSVKKCDGDGDGIYDNGVVGLSSYFALDITDPENPKLLWEFSNPYLGFSYSGPAVMKIGSTYYVAFGSGPTNYAGESDYPLRIFVLKLNPDLTIGNVYTISQIETSTQTTPITLNNAFSGRLFVYKEGVSYNNPVFLGYTQKGSWKGGVLKLYPVVDNNNEISEWKAKIVMNKVDGQDMGPITAKVVEAEVAGEKWLIFGEGRYFTGANDDPDAIRRIYGVKADIEENADIEDVTDNVSGISSGNGWFIRLEGASGGYNAERMITDPIAVDTGYENIAFFITFQPTADVCGFGGRTFVWTVTTTGGGAISNPGFGGKLFVQVSTGQIATFTKAEGRKSGPIQGVPSETAPAFVRHFSAIGYKGKILHIIER